MRFRTLGRTELSVSEISLGTVEIGLDYGIHANGTAQMPDERESAMLLNRALDLGVNLIDTARAYGRSEEIIGRAVSRRRSEFLICSKVLAKPGVNKQDVTDSLEQSLRLLKTDVIDIYMIHSATLDVIQEGAMADILNELRVSGKIRFTGASVYGEDAALAAIASGSFDCLQIAQSVLDRLPEKTVLPAAQQSNIGLIARSVLLKGALTPRYRHLPETLSELRNAVERLEAIAGSSLPELAYRYVLNGPQPHTALVGASGIHELEAAVQFAEKGPLPEDLIEKIRSIELSDVSLLNPATWPIG
jgi:aryl-alcohol dehydrogenase-like predicted oxidoreductase